MRLDFDGDGLHTAVIAVASALPAAVAHPCRWSMKTKSIIMVVIGLIFLPGCTTRHRESTESDRKLAVAFQKEPGECIPRSWLLEELSDEELASDQRVTPEAHRMLQSRLPGDSIHSYRSPPETWAALLGRAGLVIVRDGKPVSCVDTVIN